MSEPKKGGNPIKLMLIITIVLLIATVAVVLFKKDRILLEDEEGNTLVGASGKFLKVETEE